MSHSGLIDPRENRSASRADSNLEAVVQVEENNNNSWKEVVTVLSLSRLGAGFSALRPFTPGRLVRLVLEMPSEFRAYDKRKKLYPVFGLVQYCNESDIDGNKKYFVGVGFIGRNIPKSYKIDPEQSFRIAGPSPEGLWRVIEAASPFKTRSSPRFRHRLEVTITLLLKEQKEVERETCYTIEIGERGTSVECSLEAEIGETVKFACKDVNFYTFAVVRNRRERKDGSTTLHLEFVDSTFPVLKLDELGR